MKKLNACMLSFSYKALAKLANIAWQILLFVSESLALDEKVSPDLRQKQQCLASNVGQFCQALKNYMPSVSKKLLALDQLKNKSLLFETKIFEIRSKCGEKHYFKVGHSNFSKPILRSAEAYQRNSNLTHCLQHYSV